MVQLELDEFYLESRFIFKPEIIILDSVMGMNYGLKQGHIIFPRQFSDDAVVGHAFLEGYIDVGDGCWKRNVLVRASRWHQYPLSFYNSVGHQHSKGVAKIEIRSPTSKNCHQLDVINITMSRIVSSHINSLCWT